MMCNTYNGYKLFLSFISDFKMTVVNHTRSHTTLGWIKLVKVKIMSSVLRNIRESALIVGQVIMTDIYFLSQYNQNIGKDMGPFRDEWDNPLLAEALKK